MKQSRINWNITADVECPSCLYENDFMEEDDWYDWCEPGENVKHFGPYLPTIVCHNCGEKFEVTGSDY